MNVHGDELPIPINWSLGKRSLELNLRRNHKRFYPVPYNFNYQLSTKIDT